jgi:cytochrome c oxidase subunit 1
LNLLSSIGAAIFALSFVLMLWNIFKSLNHGEMAGDNPWDAPSLEWATASPPPPYNFDRIPVVTSRYPLWSDREVLPVASGLALDTREIVLSTVAGGRPDLLTTSPRPSIWPLLAAVAVGATFLGSIFTGWAVVWGAIPIGITLIGWGWPKGKPEDES